MDDEKGWREGGERWITRRQMRKRSDEGALLKT